MAIVKFKVLLGPPPGAEVKTLIDAVPAVFSRPAGTETVSLFPKTKWVGRATSFQYTTDRGTNVCPLTVIVNGPDPAVTELGLTENSAGAGISIVNVAAVLGPPPGHGATTLTYTFSTFVIALSGTIAVSLVAEYGLVICIASPLK